MQSYNTQPGSLELKTEEGAQDWPLTIKPTTHGAEINKTKYSSYDLAQSLTSCRKANV